MKQTVYTASPESQQIHVWSLDLEGNLKLVQVVDAPGQVQPMVVSPNKEYLYVGVRPEFRVLAYRIAPDNGALTFAGEAAQPGRCAADPMVVEQLRISDLSVLAGAALSQRLPHLVRGLTPQKSEKFF